MLGNARIHTYTRRLFTVQIRVLCIALGATDVLLVALLAWLKAMLLVPAIAHVEISTASARLVRAILAEEARARMMLVGARLSRAKALHPHCRRY